MNNEPMPCKRCKNKPNIIEVSGLFYVQCNPDCTKWLPYQFLGTSPKTAIENWNDANSNKPLENYE